MYSEIYWIETYAAGRLGIMARPRSGDWLEDEVANWKREKVGIVLSLLEKHEIIDLGLQNEPSLCEASGIRYLSFPIPDRGVPFNFDEAISLASQLACQERPVAIHCRAGIGRSSIIAAAIMIGKGVEPSAALAAITAARRLEVPDTDAQREWVLDLHPSAFATPR